MAEQALQIATKLRDQHELSMAYRAMAMVHRYSNKWDRFRDVVAERTKVLGASLAPVDLDLYNDLVFGYIVARDIASAERVAREFLAVSEKIRSPSASHRAIALLVTTLFLGNMWDETLHAASGPWNSRELNKRARSWRP